jgi:hypothetical protein
MLSVSLDVELIAMTSRNILLELLSRDIRVAIVNALAPRREAASPPAGNLGDLQATRATDL